MYKVDAPDVVRMGRPQPYDRSILVVEPSALLVPLRQLKAFFAPDPLNLLVVHLPTFDAQQFGYLAIAVAPVLLGQLDQGQSQSIIISPGRLGIAENCAPVRSPGMSVSLTSRASGAYGSRPDEAVRSSGPRL